MFSFRKGITDSIIIERTPMEIFRMFHNRTIVDSSDISHKLEKSYLEIGFRRIETNDEKHSFDLNSNRFYFIGIKNGKIVELIDLDSPELSNTHLLNDIERRQTIRDKKLSSRVINLSEYRK